MKGRVPGLPVTLLEGGPGCDREDSPGGGGAQRCKHGLLVRLLEHAVPCGLIPDLPIPLMPLVLRPLVSLGNWFLLACLMWHFLNWCDLLHTSEGLRSMLQGKMAQT